MRIVHLDTGRGLRGGQQQVLFLMRGLAAQSHSQILLAPPRSPLALRVRADGFEVVELSLRNQSALRGVNQIRRVIERFKPEVLHFHDARGHGFGYLANRKLQLPAVVSRRVAFPLKLGLLSRTKYLAPRQRFIAVSRFVKDLMIRSGIDERLIDVVYDCVDIGIEPGRAPRGKSHDGRRHFLLGTVGALEVEKGHDVMIKAISRIRSSLPECRCIIAGTGRLRSSLKRLITAHHLEESVVIVPPPDSSPDFLHELDLFVLPSRAEGLGSIILLAMQCGVPVLASNAGGIPELVEDTVTGFLFPADDVAALSCAISGLAQSPSRRLSVIDRAKTRLKSRFSIEVMTESTLRCYETVIHSS